MLFVITKILIYFYCIVYLTSLFEWGNIMLQEIELKLAILPQIGIELPQYLAKFTILEHQNLFLGNTYYDYPDYFLAKQKWDYVFVKKNKNLH